MYFGNFLLFYWACTARQDGQDRNVKNIKDNKETNGTQHKENHATKIQKIKVTKNGRSGNFKMKIGSCHIAQNMNEKIRKILP